jgi:hypothetical protein
MTDTPLDLTKPMKRRDGLQVLRVLCTDAAGERPLVVQFVDYTARAYSLHGRFLTQVQCNHNYDLINAPEPPMEIWVNVYKSGTKYIYNTQLDADRKADIDRIGPARLFREVKP